MQTHKLMINRDQLENIPYTASSVPSFSHMITYYYYYTDDAKKRMYCFSNGYTCANKYREKYITTGSVEGEHSQPHYP